MKWNTGGGRLLKSGVQSSHEIFWNHLEFFVFSCKSFVISWISSREFRSEISVEFTDLRIIGETSKEFEWLQVTSGNFDRIPVTSSDFQKEIWVESTKFEDNSSNLRRILTTSNDFKWLLCDCRRFPQNSSDFKWLPLRIH